MVLVAAVDISQPYRSENDIAASLLAKGLDPHLTNRIGMINEHQGESGPSLSFDCYAASASTLEHSGASATLPICGLLSLEHSAVIQVTDNGHRGPVP